MSSLRKHTKGSDCNSCCCSRPTACEEKDCKGFVHLEVVDEMTYDDGDWAWIHNYKCDTCEYKEYPEPQFPIEFENEN